MTSPQARTAAMLSLSVATPSESAMAVASPVSSSVVSAVVWPHSV